MGASVDDRMDERISKLFGLVVRESPLLPPGTIAFVDPKTMTTVGYITGLDKSPPEDFSNCYSWFTPRR